MYNIYPPPYPPPYGPPPYNPMQTPLSPSEFERGIRIAVKLKSKEENKIKKKEEAEKKKKEEDKKKAEAARMRSLTGIEWFIIGLLMYPVVGPAYKLITHNLDVLSSGVK